ncbi:MAG: type II toxin-antitoxin system VapC family toxin [Candidatus Zixiibacteriota bacterium]
MILLDTVSLIRHFTGNANIGNEAKEIIAKTISEEKMIFISVISLMEVIYLSEKNRIDLDLNQTIDSIESNENYKIVDLTPQILEIAWANFFYELHDRLIIATAKWLDVPLVTSDRKIRDSEIVDTIWD